MFLTNTSVKSRSSSFQIIQKMVPNLKRYPHSSNPKSWQNQNKFIKRKESLLQYYMAPKGGIRDETVLEKLYSNIMVGIDNSKNWSEATGFKISKKVFHGSTFQVRTFLSHFLWVNDVNKSCDCRQSALVSSCQKDIASFLKRWGMTIHLWVSWLNVMEIIYRHMNLTHYTTIKV